MRHPAAANIYFVQIWATVISDPWGVFDIAIVCLLAPGVMYEKK
jgi:hypothetical protein